MEIIIISMILLLYFIAMIVSEIKQITMFTAIGEVALAIWNYVIRIYQIVFRKDDIISFPTAIGFDANGAFIPSIAEDEFSELKSIFDGLYLSNFECQRDRYIYFFKFARITIDMEAVDFFKYAEKKVAMIVNRYASKMMGVAEIENISAIEIDKGILNIALARNPNGQQLNKEWKCSESNRLNEIENEAKRECEPICIKWEDLII